MLQEHPVLVYAVIAFAFSVCLGLCACTIFKCRERPRYTRDAHTGAPVPDSAGGAAPEMRAEEHTPGASMTDLAARYALGDLGDSDGAGSTDSDDEVTIDLADKPAAHTGDGVLAGTVEMSERDTGDGVCLL